VPAPPFSLVKVHTPTERPNFYSGLVKKIPDARRAKVDERRRTLSVRWREIGRAQQSRCVFFNSPLKSAMELVVAVSQVIRFRTAQLMPQVSQSLDSYTAFILRFGGQTIEPIEHRNCLAILVKDNGNLGHVILIMFVLLRTSVKRSGHFDFSRILERSK
jgi:hypothetical protein